MENFLKEKILETTLFEINKMIYKNRRKLLSVFYGLKQITTNEHL